MNTNPFPDGVVPALPALPISKLTSKFLNQQQVDQSLERLKNERPDLVLKIIENEVSKQGDLELVHLAIKDFIALTNQADVSTFQSAQYLWELRVRVRKLLGLPATPDEVKAASDKGEVVL